MDEDQLPRLHVCQDCKVIDQVGMGDKRQRSPTDDADPDDVVMSSTLSREYWDWWFSDQPHRWLDEHGWHVLRFSSWSRARDHIAWCEENLGRRHRGLMGLSSWRFSNRGLWRWDHAYFPHPGRTEKDVFELRFRRESDAIMFSMRWL